MRDDIDIHLNELVRLKIVGTSSTNSQRDVRDERHRQDDANLVDDRRRHHRAIGIYQKIYAKDADLDTLFARAP